MEGMILAAGAGTRLGSLTDELPKALVEVGGKPLLGWVAEGLFQAGVRRIIINTHHHEEQIRAYVRDSGIRGVDFVISPEPEGPFETGGGLFHAASHFQESQPFLLHNADVLSTIPLGDLVERHRGSLERHRGSLERHRGSLERHRGSLERHREAGAGEVLEDRRTRLIASLAVQRRDSRRVLLFDDLGLLGWENRGSDRARDGKVQVREPVGAIRRWSFTGIHVVDPAVFGLTDRTGSFSIITLYLELAAAGWIINPIDVSESEWFDVGTPERLEDARTRFSG